VKSIVGFTMLASLFYMFTSDIVGVTNGSATTHLLRILFGGVLSIGFYLLIVFSVTWALYQLYKVAQFFISRGKRVWDDLPEENQQSPQVTVDARISKTYDGWIFEGRVYPTLFSAQAALKLDEKENVDHIGAEVGWLAICPHTLSASSSSCRRMPAATS